jgi:glutamate-1-semialdehyde 2,1-aminomutase
MKKIDQLLQELEFTYTENRQKSKKLFEEAKKIIPGGVVSNLAYMTPFPIFMKAGRESKIYDVDENEYIDYRLSYSSLLLGHGHPYILQKVKDHLTEHQIIHTGTPHDLQITLANRLCDIFPSGEAVRFFCTGTEATMNSIRLARAYTGKSLIAKFEGHYHGSQDYTLFSLNPSIEEAGDPLYPLTVPNSLGISKSIFEDTLVLPFNDIEATKFLIDKHKNELAAIIMEPLLRGYLPAGKSFLKKLRQICSKNNILLIFDEVITGFTVGAGGAQSYYNVVPDITCLGKALGGGLPISALLGKKEIMQKFSPIGLRTHEHLYHSQTYPGNLLCAITALATLDIFEKKETYKKINHLTNALKAGINQQIKDTKINAQLVGLGAFCFNILFTKDKVVNYRDTTKADTLKRKIFDFIMFCNGVFVYGNGRFSLSLQHTMNDIKKTLAATKIAFENITALE